MWIPGESSVTVALCCIEEATEIVTVLPPGLEKRSTVIFVSIPK